MQMDEKMKDILLPLEFAWGLEVEMCSLGQDCSQLWNFDIWEHKLKTYLAISGVYVLPL